MSVCVRLHYMSGLLQNIIYLFVQSQHLSSHLNGKRHKMHITEIKIIVK